MHACTADDDDDDNWRRSFEIVQQQIIILVRIEVQEKTTVLKGEQLLTIMDT